MWICICKIIYFSVFKSVLLNVGHSLSLEMPVALSGLVRLRLEIDTGTALEEQFLIGTWRKCVRTIIDHLVMFFKCGSPLSCKREIEEYTLGHVISELQEFISASIDMIFFLNVVSHFFVYVIGYIMVCYKSVFI